MIRAYLPRVSGTFLGSLAPLPERLCPNVEDCLGSGTLLLERAGIETARLDVECLLADVLASTRWQVILEPRRRLTQAEFGRYLALLERRERREPLAYLLGTREFWSLPLAVSSGVLIPRPETETLVEAALAVLGQMHSQPLRRSPAPTPTPWVPGGPAPGRHRTVHRHGRRRRRAGTGAACRSHHRHGHLAPGAPDGPHQRREARRGRPDHFPARGSLARPGRARTGERRGPGCLKSALHPVGIPRDPDARGAVGASAGSGRGAGWPAVSSGDHRHSLPTPAAGWIPALGDRSGPGCSGSRAPGTDGCLRGPSGLPGSGGSGPRRRGPTQHQFKMRN